MSWKRLSRAYAHRPRRAIPFARGGVTSARARSYMHAHMMNARIYVYYTLRPARAIACACAQIRRLTDVA